MSHPLRIAIIGYGVAGIAAAIQLRRLGHAIEHFERNAKGQSSGAGLLLHPPTLKLLGELDLLDALDERGTRIARIRAETVSGRRIIDLHYADHRTPGFALGIQRGALIELMRAADPAHDQLRTSHSIISVDAERGYLLDAARTRHGPYDLIVAADGANSQIRQQHLELVGRDRQYASAALVCLLQDADRLVGDTLSQHFDGNEHVSFWSAGAFGTNHPSLVSLAIKVSAAQTHHQLELGHWKTQISRLCPSIVPLLARADDSTPMLPYRYRDVALQHFVKQRLVLLGDAAHSMSPQLGQGVRLALEDAHILAASLKREKTLAVALTTFSRRRRAQVLQYQILSRAVTPLFQSDSRILGWLRDWLVGPMTQIPGLRRRFLEVLCE